MGMWLSLGRWWYRVWSLDSEKGVRWKELLVDGGEPAYGSTMYSVRRLKSCMVRRKKYISKRASLDMFKLKCSDF